MKFMYPSEEDKPHMRMNRASAWYAFQPNRPVMRELDSMSEYTFRSDFYTGFRGLLRVLR